MGSSLQSQPDMRQSWILIWVLITMPVLLTACLGGNLFEGGKLDSLHQTYEIQGRIFDGSAGDTPLPGAEVSSGRVSTVTTADGVYVLAGVGGDPDAAQGDDVIRVRIEASGFAPQTVDVPVQQGRQLVHDFTLYPAEAGSGGEDDGDVTAGDHGDTESHAGTARVQVRLLNTPVNRTQPAASPVLSTMRAGPASAASISSSPFPAADPHVVGEWIVELDEGHPVQAVSTLFTRAGVHGARQLADSNFYLVSADEAAAADLEGLPGNVPNVRSVSRNQRVFPADGPLRQREPNDQHYRYQWNYPQISLPDAWRITTGHTGVVVAILDTGLAPNHPDIPAGSIVSGRNFVSDQPAADYWDHAPHFSHGTAVTGIIGAQTNNSQGMAGMNWSISLMPVRVMSSDSGGTVAAVGEGIRWAVQQGADVINMSLAWHGDGPDHAAEAFVREQIEYAARRGVTMVAGSGNDNSRVLMPAKHPEVIAVGAVDRYKRRAPYSNYGPELELMAPGGDMSGTLQDGVLSTDMTHGSAEYAFHQGTSLASPHVAGLAALMKSAGVGNREMIRSLLRSTAEDLGTPGLDEQYGYGLVNAYAAVLGLEVQAALVGVATRDGEEVFGTTAPQAGDGMATLTGITSGRHLVFGWIDVTGTDRVEAGDFAGIAVVDMPLDGAVDVELGLIPFQALSADDKGLLQRIVNR